MCLGKFIRNWRWLRKETKTFTKPSESSNIPFHRLKKNMYSLDFYNITENRNPPPESSMPFHRLKKYIYFLQTFTTSLKIETHHQKVQSHSSTD
jgi:hypothetical protein